jgi:hypothetical protein
LRHLVSVLAGVVVAGVTVVPVWAEVIDPPTRVTVTPSADLVDGQVVTVTGAGFNTNAQIYVGACAVVTTDPFQCDTANTSSVVADGNGAFTTTFSAARYVRHPDGHYVDCSTASCTIGATDLSVTASVAVTFVGGPPPTPTAAVTPSSGLVDGQVIQVSGAGFPAGTIYQYGQCPTDATTAEECYDFWRHGAGVARGGIIDTWVDVYRLVRDVNNVVIRDCVVDACAVGIAWSAGFALIPISFADVALGLDIHATGLHRPSDGLIVAQASVTCDVATPLVILAEIVQPAVQAVWSNSLTCDPSTPTAVFLPGWYRTPDQRFEPGTASVDLSVYPASSGLRDVPASALTSSHREVTLLDEGAIAAALREQLADPATADLVRQQLITAILTRLEQDPLFRDEWIAAFS